MQYIKLGGKQRPVHFGFASIRQLERLEGRTMTEIFGDIENNASMSTILNLTYAGLFQGARKEKKQAPESVEQVADWLDDSQDGLNEVMEAFSASMETSFKENKKASQKKAK